MSARDRLAREEGRSQQLGDDATCSQCGETLLDALTAQRGGPVCYECLARARGRPTVEWHHPTGKANDPAMVVGLPGNLHRALDAMKDIWPDEVRKNPDGDPLVRIIQLALAQRDWATVMPPAWQAASDYLQLLHRRLREKFGDDWREVLGLPPFPGEIHDKPQSK